MSRDTLSERAEVVGDDLVITIPLEVLAGVLLGSSSWPPEDDITDIRALAVGIAKQITREAEEDGSTRLHLMLDVCAEKALEDGCEGVRTNDDDEGVDQ